VTQVFDDFSSYSTGNVASVASPNWSVQATPASDWTQTVADDAGNRGIQVTRTSAGASTGMIVNDAVGAISGDIEIYARFKVDTTTNSVTAAGPVLAASDNQCYGLSIIDASNVRLYRFSTTQSQGTAIAVSIAFAVPDQAYVKIRIGRSGTTIRAKIWLDADSEPGSWSTSGTNTTLTDLKGGIVSRATQLAPIFVSDYGIGTAGDSAPTTTASTTTLNPAQATLTMVGQQPSANPFTKVLIRTVLINEAGSPLGGLTGIHLKVWYGGRAAGAPDLSLSNRHTEAGGSTSWSLAIGSLIYNQAVFYVADDGGASLSLYTCARTIPSYE
jgi:hypothetical protein